MRRLTSEELSYVGQLAIQAFEGGEAVWCRETGHINTMSCVHKLHEAEDADLATALQIDGYMSKAERVTCDSLNDSLAEIEKRMFDCLGNGITYGETGLHLHYATIAVKAVIVREIARYMEELAEETSKAA